MTLPTHYSDRLVCEEAIADLYQAMGRDRPVFVWRSSTDALYAELHERMGLAKEETIFQELFPLQAQNAEWSSSVFGDFIKSLTPTERDTLQALTPDREVAFGKCSHFT